MKMTIDCLVTKDEQIGSSYKIRPELIILKTIPNVNNEISVKFRNEETDFEEVVQSFKVVKRIFYNSNLSLRNKDNRSCDLTLVLHACNDDHKYKVLLMNCVLHFNDFSSEIDWSDQNSVFLEIEERPQFTFSFMPTNNYDFIEFRGSYYQYINTFYNTDANETSVSIRNRWTREEIFR
jgi:hypothetical protein